MKNELATISDFKIASTVDSLEPELLAQLQDELDDLDSDIGFDCLRIKVPSGGGQAFEVQAGDSVDYLKELDCVVVYTHKANSWWGSSYGGQDTSPICSSMDGKTGINVDGKSVACATCPNNQYGSAINMDGSRGKGKACKNMRRLYLLMSGKPDVYVLTIPPTSTREIDKAMKKMLMSGQPYTGSVVRFTLERTANAAGISYSKVKMTRLGTLPADQLAKVQSWRSRIKADHTQMGVEAADYNAPVAETASAPASASAPHSPVFEEAEEPDGDFPF